MGAEQSMLGSTRHLGTGSTGTRPVRLGGWASDRGKNIGGTQRSLDFSPHGIRQCSTAGEVIPSDGQPKGRELIAQYGTRAHLEGATYCS